LEQNIQSLKLPLAMPDERPRSASDIAGLTRRMAAGDESAWRTFYEAYFDRLWRYLLVVATGNEDAAREALQSTLVRVARHIKIFADETALWNWLAVIARNAFADETKKRRRYFSFLDRFTGQADVELDGTDDTQIEERFRNLLERHIALLPADERTLVEQKYFAHRSVRDIAGGLQITEKAVESKLSRVRKKLKDAILSELNEEKD
jgi:RNA polymerase sigma-70 factor (ECF subfamily)